MFRQLSGGNNRPRSGLKPKDALHISLILAVSIWILYHLTYTYPDNSIIDSYMPVTLHQEHKIKQESTLDFSGDLDTGTTGKINIVDFEEERRKNVDTVHEDRGKSEDAVNENDVGKEREITSRIKEHEARERSFKDDDVSSAVHHDYRMPEVKEESTSGIKTYSQKLNLTNSDSKFDVIMGNGTINGTSFEKNISHLGNFSIKPDGIKDIGEDENIPLVNMDEYEGLIRDGNEQNK